MKVIWSRFVSIYSKCLYMYNGGKHVDLLILLTFRVYVRCHGTEAAVQIQLSFTRRLTNPLHRYKLSVIWLCVYAIRFLYNKSYAITVKFKYQAAAFQHNNDISSLYTWLYSSSTHIHDICRTVKHEPSTSSRQALPFKFRTCIDAFLARVFSLLQFRDFPKICQETKSGLWISAPKELPWSNRSNATKLYTFLHPQKQVNFTT